MRINYLFFGLLTTVGLTLTSCTKDEAPSMEADIKTASITNEDEYLLTTPAVSNNTVVFRLKQNTEEMSFAPNFTLSEGATITPASGTLLNFSEGSQQYTVTSEGGFWKKSYTVSFLKTKFPLHFSFENHLLFYGQDQLEESFDPNREYEPATYVNFFEYDIDGTKDLLWSSGNIGFAILPAATLGLKSPLEYPTAPLKEGVNGYGVKLETMLTGFDHNWLTPGLAAGNLFLGSFNTKHLFNALKATEFGIPYTLEEKPVKFTGYYKYKAGTTFGEKDFYKPVGLDGNDMWDAYAIVFEKRENNNFLNGDHNFQDDRMVLQARIDHKKYPETDSWTEFEAVFEEVPGKTFDPTKEYFIAIVISSSIQGSNFKGAIGSTLQIDELQLVLEEN